MVSSGLSIYFSFLELALLHFAVDMLKGISTKIYNNFDPHLNSLIFKVFQKVFETLQETVY